MCDVVISGVMVEEVAAEAAVVEVVAVEDLPARLEEVEEGQLHMENEMML